MGDLVTAMSDGVERTGILVDFHIIRTSVGNEYAIAPSTVRHPDWGMYCRHGLKIVEAEPAEHTCERPPSDPPGCFDPFGPGSSTCPACYPADRKVDPWPCHEEGCTEADFDQEMQQEIDNYWDAINDLMRTQYE